MNPRWSHSLTSSRPNPALLFCSMIFKRLAFCSTWTFRKCPNDDTLSRKTSENLSDPTTLVSLDIFVFFFSCGAQQFGEKTAEAEVMGRNIVWQPSFPHSSFPIQNFTNRNSLCINNLCWFFSLLPTRPPLQLPTLVSNWRWSIFRPVYVWEATKHTHLRHIRQSLGTSHDLSSQSR